MRYLAGNLVVWSSKKKKNPETEPRSTQCSIFDRDVQWLFLIFFSTVAR